MEQVKIFESMDGQALQKNVNDWLKENDGKIEILERKFHTYPMPLSVVSGHYNFITIVYHYELLDSHDLQKAPTNLTPSHERVGQSSLKITGLEASVISLVAECPDSEYFDSEWKIKELLTGSNQEVVGFAIGVWRAALEKKQK